MKYVVTRAIIYDGDNRILLAKRAGGRGAGQWSLLGGKPDPGESAEQAVVREVKEESNLDFIPRLFKEVVDGVSDDRGEWQVYYFAGPTTGKIKVDLTEHSEAGYFKREELDNLDIAFAHLGVIDEWLKQA